MTEQFEIMRGIFGAFKKIARTAFVFKKKAVQDNAELYLTKDSEGKVFFCASRELVIPPHGTVDLKIDHHLIKTLPARIAFPTESLKYQVRPGLFLDERQQSDKQTQYFRLVNPSSRPYVLYPNDCILRAVLVTYEDPIVKD